ncbi:MAG: hypothetical protein OXC81_06485, partial [Betaproteobacteria bacterium]|nr:hypothetical protein [Betaproteobacteria bacterium]
MATQQRSDDNITLTVKDFGPIAEAQVEMRPLTVFIGPGNTGKSWLSVLIYALHKFAGNNGEDGILSGAVREAIASTPTGLDDAQVAQIKETLLADKMIEQLLDSGKERSETLTAQLCRCYGCAGIETLVARNAACQSIINVRDSSATLLEIGLTDKAWIKPPDPAALRQRLQEAIDCTQDDCGENDIRRFCIMLARKFSL